jgi:hypothetical protein
MSYVLHLIDKRINATTEVLVQARHDRIQELLLERGGTGRERFLPELFVVPEALNDGNLGTCVTILDLESFWQMFFSPRAFFLAC